MLSGEIVVGEVAWVSESAVAIKQLDEIVAKERVIEAQEIAQIEVAEETQSDVYVLGVLIGAGIVYAIVEGFKGMSIIGN